MRLLDFYGSLSSDRREIRAKELEMRRAGFSQADVRAETLRAEAALVAKSSGCVHPHRTDPATFCADCPRG